MKTVPTTGPADLLNKLSLRNKQHNPAVHTMIFRGQADSSWEIIPKALRPETKLPHRGVISDSPLRTNRDQIESEVEIIQDFINILNANGHHVPHESTISAPTNILRYSDFITKLGRSESIWPPKEYHSIIALAQHYGLPTRFTDWTYNPYVAAYFAARDWTKVKEEKGVQSDHIAIYAIDLWGSPFRDFDFEEDSTPSNPLKQDWLYQLIESPTFFNKNLRAQKGLFLAYIQINFEKNGPIERKSVEQYIQLCDEQPMCKCRATKYTMDGKKCRELLRLLSLEFYSSSTIFPGIEGCAKDVYDKYIWQK